MGSGPIYRVSHRPSRGDPRVGMPATSFNPTPSTGVVEPRHDCYPMASPRPITASPTLKPFPSVPPAPHGQPSSQSTAKRADLRSTPPTYAPVSFIRFHPRVPQSSRPPASYLTLLHQQHGLSPSTTPDSAPPPRRSLPVHGSPRLVHHSPAAWTNRRRNPTSASPPPRVPSQPLCGPHRRIQPANLHPIPRPPNACRRMPVNDLLRHHQKSNHQRGACHCQCSVGRPTSR